MSCLLYSRQCWSSNSFGIVVVAPTRISRFRFVGFFFKLLPLLITLNGASFFEWRKITQKNIWRSHRSSLEHSTFSFKCWHDINRPKWIHMNQVQGSCYIIQLFAHMWHFLWLFIQLDFQLIHSAWFPTDSLTFHSAWFPTEAVLSTKHVDWRIRSLQVEVRELLML